MNATKGLMRAGVNRAVMRQHGRVRRPAGAEIAVAEVERFTAAGPASLRRVVFAVYQD
jgi:hypothetical protein